jgi:uncharacterized protein YecA (UPF0149 family)
MQYTAADAPVQGSSGIRPAVEAEQAQADGGGGTAVAVDEAPAVQQVVKTAEQKLGRNQPCWCGSGKKFKLCHGK